MKKIRIGSGAGYAGDRIEPAVELMEKGNLERNCSVAERQEIKTTQVKICINTESKRYQKVKEV
mgnify:CR=1 FL=1